MTPRIDHCDVGSTAGRWIGRIATRRNTRTVTPSYTPCTTSSSICASSSESRTRHADRCVKVLHLGKFDGDVGGIERYVRGLLGGLPADIECINLVANDRAVTDQHRNYRYLTVRAANHGVVASVAL